VRCVRSGFLIPGLVALWAGVLYDPLHHNAVPHAVVMTIGGLLVGVAHLVNLRLNHGHVHDALRALARRDRISDRARGRPARRPRRTRVSTG
jgi:hypothetical protein